MMICMMILSSFILIISIKLLLLPASPSQGEHNYSLFNDEFLELVGVSLLVIHYSNDKKSKSNNPINA